MRTIVFLLLLSAVPVFAEVDINFFGPRAGIGFAPQKTGTSLDEGVHSAFGWQVEIPYKSDKLTGYGEAGFLLLATEQGIFYPDAWGFFGFRYGFIGFGAGPVVNPMGIGLGFGPYINLVTGKLRIPIGINTQIIDKKVRFQSLIGFNFL